MRVEFWLRTPGNFHKVSFADMDVVPRQGEMVFLEEAGHVVHSIDWHVEDSIARAAVMLNEP